MEIKDKILQTGTTTVGVVCKDGVVMASESQATMGTSLLGCPPNRIPGAGLHRCVSGC